MLSGLILSKVYNYAKPQINQNQEKAIKKAIFNIFPSTKDYKLKHIKEKEVYFCYDKSKKLIGYAFQASGMGYQGKIIIMVGLNKDLDRLTGIEILNHSETPGLGGKLVKEEFKKQFKGLKIHPTIEYTKGLPEKDNQIQAITGATVTSKSVVSILNRKVKEVIEVLEYYYEKKN